MITQQATEALRLQLRPQCKLQKSGGRAQELVIHWIPARKGAECDLDVACSQRAEDGSRCRDILRERPNAHAPRNGQDRGVVPRSMNRSAPVRRCESTASKSGAKGRYGRSASSTTSGTCGALQKADVRQSCAIADKKLEVPSKLRQERWSVSKKVA